MTEWKVCTKCGHNKPLERFRKDNRKSDGRGYVCKECDAASAKVRMANIRHQEKEMHSTNPPVRTGANKVRTFARPQINMGATIDDEGREIVEFTPDQVQLIQYLSNAPYENHWQYNLQMGGLMGHPDDYPCVACGRDAIMFHGYGQSALDFAPTCINCAESEEFRNNAVHWAYDMFIGVYEMGEAEPTVGILNEIRNIPDDIDSGSRMDALLSIFYFYDASPEAIGLMIEAEIISPAHEYQCYLCEKRALEFTPWNRSVLEIVPTCHAHTGNIQFDIAQRWYLDSTDWQGTLARFLRPVEYV